MQEGMRILCDVAGAILIMDETTRDDFASGFPGVELPASHMLAVPKETGHWERAVLDAAAALKKDLVRQSEVLTPAQADAFRNCTLKVMVLDERRHAKDRMLDRREYELLRLFKFDLCQGQGNENCLAAKGNQTEASKGTLWCVSDVQFVALLAFLGSPEAFVPADSAAAAALVQESLKQLKTEVTMVQAAVKPIPTMFDQDTQCDLGTETLKTMFSQDTQCDLREVSETGRELLRGERYLDVRRVRAHVAAV